MALRSESWPLLAAQVLSIPSVSTYDGVARPQTTSRSVATGSFDYTNEVDSAKYHKIVIAHAVLACSAWALFAPLGAILLRSGARGINLLKLHAFWQLLVYAMYVTAAGLGIWMRLQLSGNGAVWRYPHAAIGLVMLIGVFFQPWLGYIHHKIFKRRLEAINTGDTTKKLGRTIITQVHLWLGRLLITVGVINGGLGIMVTWDRGDSLQSMEISRRAAIAYATIAGTVFLIYATFMFRHEYRRAPLVMNVAEGGSSAEGSSTASDKSMQSIEIGRRFSVFSEEVPELSEKDRSRSRGRRGSSNDKLRMVTDAPAKAHSPTISPNQDAVMGKGLML